MMEKIGARPASTDFTTTCRTSAPGASLCLTDPTSLQQRRETTHDRRLEKRVNCRRRSCRRQQSNSWPSPDGCAKMGRGHCGRPSKRSPGRWLLWRRSLHIWVRFTRKVLSVLLTVYLEYRNIKLIKKKVILIIQWSTAYSDLAEFLTEADWGVIRYPGKLQLRKLCTTIWTRNFNPLLGLATNRKANLLLLELTLKLYISYYWCHETYKLRFLFRLPLSVFLFLLA